MKKTLAILAAVLLIALSAMPAFAAEIYSPQPTIANFEVKIIPDPNGGGSYDFDYVTPVGDDGTQVIHLSATPYDGYTFTGWTIDGKYTTNGKLTDTELDLTISSDITATPVFTKNGEEAKTAGTPTKIDNSTKSPKTGSVDYIFAGIASIAVVGILFITKKKFYK